MTALSFHEVSAVVGGRRIVDRVSFEVPVAGRVAIVGPNGSGKSTIARLAAGLLRPTSGAISVFDSGWTEKAEAGALRGRVGVGLARGALLSDLTVVENVRAALGPRRRSGERRARVQVERALADAGAESYADAALPSLSLGERRRAELARLLVTEPDLMILDDVLLGVDPRAAADLIARLLGAIGRRRRAILWLGSDATVAGQFADNVARLENGILSRV